MNKLATKVDLHSHSIASPDGSLTAAHYRRMLDSGRLDCIAITDHNRIDFALELHEELGDSIVVGEEIKTDRGEIIGLFLTKPIDPHMSPQATIAAIRQQGGLVYIPHPFETVRQGMTPESMEIIAGEVDVIEVHNGRAVFQNRSKQAYAWAVRHGCLAAASSDSHGWRGWGRTYTRIAAVPDRQTILELLQECEYVNAFPGIRAVLYPTLSRLGHASSRVRKRRHA